MPLQIRIRILRLWACRITSTHQLEVTEVTSNDVQMAAEDEGGNASSRSRPPRPGDIGSISAAARNKGTGGIKEGAATDQEEGGGVQRERGRPSSAQSAKSSSSKVEDELSLLRIGGALTGADGVSSGGDGVSSGVQDNGEHRARQDSSRSPLPHENGAGGEDDASVLDTPLQDKVRPVGTDRQSKAAARHARAGATNNVMLMLMLCCVSRRCCADLSWVCHRRELAQISATLSAKVEHAIDSSGWFSLFYFPISRCPNSLARVCDWPVLSFPSSTWREMVAHQTTTRSRRVWKNRSRQG